VFLVSLGVIISICFILIICDSNSVEFLGVSALQLLFNKYSLGLSLCNWLTRDLYIISLLVYLAK
jgi:hypothetical protein